MTCFVEEMAGDRGMDGGVALTHAMKTSAAPHANMPRGDGRRNDVRTVVRMWACFFYFGKSKW
jgi:hypothetical protein